MATKAMVISTATPKNGARQLIEPSWPPRIGPVAMPRPRAASKRITDCATEPREDTTIVESAVAMNSALPRPQPARKPTMAPIESLAPASAENTTISARPASRVRLAPIRDDTTPVISIATPITAM